MRRSSLIAASALLASLVGQAAAAEDVFKYNYVEAGYAKFTGDLTGTPGTITGYDYLLAGSYAVHDMVAIQVGYTKERASWYPPGFSGSFSGDGYSAGVDLHHMIASTTEVGLDWSHNHFSGTWTVNGFAAPSTASNGNVYGVRVRTAVVPTVWLQASAGRTIVMGASSTDYGASGEYLIGQHAGVRLEYVSSTTSGGAGHTHGYALLGRYFF